MQGDWCITWERASHVVKIDRGFYRIVLYSAPVMTRQHVLKREYLQTVHATNRKDAIAKAKLLVSGGYDIADRQPRLF